MTARPIRPIRTFLTAALTVLLVSAAVTVLFDPFYHYHKPLPGLKAVLMDKEYQCVGTLRHFNYDTVILGSSVMENTNLATTNALFGGQSIKAIRSFGRVADLAWFASEAFASGNSIRRVIWNIDPGTLSTTAQTSFAETGCPMYLYDHNPFNDLPYLWNKTVLLQKIPYEIAQSFSASHDENNPYSWAQWKEFSEETSLANYRRRRDPLPEQSPDAYAAELQGNLSLLCDIIEAHPETEFIFSYPPYSLLYWDSMARDGALTLTLAQAQETARTLLRYDNVRFYCFLDDLEIVTDLEWYLDSLHYAPEINTRMLETMAHGGHALTTDNLDAVFDALTDFAANKVPGLLVPYEEAGRFIYDD